LPAAAGRSLERLDDALSEVDPIRLRARVVAVLRRSVRFDAWCCATLDPDTLVRTSAVSEGLPTHRSAAVAANEVGEEDVVKYADLAAAGCPVGVLRAATGGQPERSARYRDILKPSGFGDELRAVLRTASGHCWGTLVLLRRQGDGGFAPRDVEVVAEAGPRVATALGRALFAWGAAGGHPVEPGVLVVGPDAEPTAVTAAARPWLAELSRPPLMQSGAVPYPVRAIARHVLATGRGTRARLPTTSGWAVLHASPLEQAPDREPAATVVIASAPAHEVVPLAVAAFGLSRREAAVADRLVAGRSTEEIGRDLHLSPYTVQDHLKEVFRKLDVSSRARAVARLQGRRPDPA
jgi:DNA-binding CsgD family transcriptional regulator/ferredoxin